MTSKIWNVVGEESKRGGRKEKVVGWVNMTEVHYI
jgi:hypothetical protein